MKHLLFFALIFCLFYQCTPKEKTATPTATAISFVRDSLLADSLYRQGADFFTTQRYALALLNINEALRIWSPILEKNDVKKARCCYVLGSSYKQTRNYRLGIEYFQKGLAIQEALKNNKKIESYSVELAAVQIDNGDLEEAKNCLVTILPLKQNLSYQGKAHKLLGIIYSAKKNYAEAIKEDDIALSLYNDYLKTVQSDATETKITNTEILECYTNAAIEYRNLKNYKKALEYLQKSSFFYKKDYKATKSLDALLNINNNNIEFGNCFLDQQQYAKAQGYYERALAGFADSSFARNPYKSEAYMGLAEALHHQKTDGIALECYERAARVLAPNGFIQEVNAPKEYFLALAGQIKILQAYNPHSASNKLTNRYQKIDTLLQTMMRHFSSDDAKFDLAEKTVPIYEGAIKNSLAFYAETKDKKYYDRALYFCERNKAVVLRQALQDKSALHFAGVPDSLIQQEHNLKVEIAYCQKNSSEQPNTATNTALSTATLALDKFLRALESTYPNYYELKYGARKTSVSYQEIQAQLPPSTLFLEYFLGDDSLYTFAISHKNINVYTQPKPSNFDTCFTLFRKSMAAERGNERDYLDNAFGFYQYFLEKPLTDFKAEGIQKLRIVPDGKLGYLPFDAFTQKKETDWQNCPSSILNDYAVSYLYSNAFLKSNTLQRSSKCVGFGNNYQGTSNNLLPFAPTLIEDAIRLFKGEAYVNEAATVQNFKQKSNNCAILYLALHGTLDERNPLNSALLFSQNQQLSAGELYNQQLKNGLTVLTACNTGTGTLRRGEGIMSLSRAFAFAGSPSMVVSLWSIGDQSTATITHRFNQYLKEGKPKDEALQLAKKEYLNDKNTSPNRRLPNCWAPYILTGDIEPLFTATWIKVLIGALSLFMGLLLYKVFRF